MPPSTIVTSSIPKLLCLEILRGCGILTEEHPRYRLFDSFRGAHLIVGDVLGGMKAPIFRLWKLPMRNSQGGFLIPPQVVQRLASGGMLAFVRGLIGTIR